MNSLVIEMLFECVQQVNIGVMSHEIIQPKAALVTHTTMSKNDIETLTEIEESDYRSYEETKAANERTLANVSDEELQIPVNDSTGHLET